MPRSSTTSIFYCQTLSSPLELLEFKAAACFKQSAVWDSGCSQIQSEGFCIAGKPTIWQLLHFLWVCNTGMKFCSFAQTWLALLSSSFASYQIIQRSLSVSHRDFLHHFNVMLFKLGYSLLINNEWGLTVCLVKSSASNGSALLKGVVEEGRKNQLHKCTSFTFRPVNIC